MPPDYRHGDIKIRSFLNNTELNDLRKNCLRKLEVSVERVSICNNIKKLAEHGLHCIDIRQKFSKGS